LPRNDLTTGPVSSPPSNKLATAWWFLRRPNTYRHLAGVAGRALLPWARRREASGGEAVAWGQPLAIPPREALTRLFGPDEYPSPDQLHPAIFAEAAARDRSTGMESLSGPANLQLLYHMVRNLPARRVVETGVSYGWSSLAILLALESQGGGILISTDMPYPRVGNEPLVGLAVPDHLRTSWTIIRRPDRPALPRALAEFGDIDLAHYDSDKTYAGQSWAFPKMWEALRPHGVLIADDIHHQRAFRDFASHTGVEPIVVQCDAKLIGVIRKPDRTE
jgi:predicted O-methyltransferase YrrM